MCFEGEIRQVLNNLVGNAIDAMPTGGRMLLRSHGRMRVRSSRHKAHRGTVMTLFLPYPGEDTEPVPSLESLRPRIAARTRMNRCGFC